MIKVLSDRLTFDRRGITERLNLSLNNHTGSFDVTIELRR